MNQHYQLSIPTPCRENLDSFDKTSEGGFCQSCQQNVVDFTKMTDREIFAYLKGHSGKLCGRFREEQMGVLS